MQNKSNLSVDSYIMLGFILGLKITSFEFFYDAKTNPKCLQNKTAHLETICSSIERVRCLVNMARVTRNIKFVCNFVIKTISLL